MEVGSPHFLLEVLLDVRSFLDQARVQNYLILRLVGVVIRFVFALQQVLIQPTQRLPRCRVFFRFLVRLFGGGHFTHTVVDAFSWGRQGF